MSIITLKTSLILRIPFKEGISFDELFLFSEKRSLLADSHLLEIEEQGRVSSKQIVKQRKELFALEPAFLGFLSKEFDFDIDYGWATASLEDIDLRKIDYVNLEFKGEEIKVFYFPKQSFDAICKVSFSLEGLLGYTERRAGLGKCQEILLKIEENNKYKPTGDEEVSLIGLIEEAFYMIKELRENRLRIAKIRNKSKILFKKNRVFISGQD